MPRSVVSYDKDLPEIPDRAPHLEPDAYLRKKAGSVDEFEIVEGRRPSRLLLVNKLRMTVSEWRNGGYPGATEVSKRLFNFWFEESLCDSGRWRIQALFDHEKRRQVVKDYLKMVGESQERYLLGIMAKAGNPFEKSVMTARRNPYPAPLPARGAG